MRRKFCDCTAFRNLVECLLPLRHTLPVQLQSELIVLTALAWSVWRKQRPQRSSSNPSSFSRVASAVWEYMRYVCDGGELEHVVTRSDSPKIQQWRDELSRKSQQVTKQKSDEVAVAVEKAKQTSEKILEATKQKSSEMADKIEVVEKAKQKSSEILEATMQKGAEVVEAAKQTSATAVEMAKQKSAEFRNDKVESGSDVKEKDESEEEWEAPSVDQILGTIIWNLLGKKW